MYISGNSCLISPYLFVRIEVADLQICSYGGVNSTNPIILGLLNF